MVPSTTRPSRPVPNGPPDPETAGLLGQARPFRGSPSCPNTAVIGGETDTPPERTIRGL